MCPPISNFQETSTLTVERVIRKCTEVIERNDILAGAGRRMENPLLSIFLGQNAIKHKNIVHDVYYSCWSERARNLIILSGAYSRENIEEAISHSTQIEGQFEVGTEFRTVWFWDIMDDDFDCCFASVKQPFSMPIGVLGHRVFFIFCSQNTTANQIKTQNRLRDQLIPWAKENNCSLVIFSDVGGMGVLRAQQISENYRLAASLMLLMNTHYHIDEKDYGKYMTFDLDHYGLWSGSYHGCSKNFSDIVGISLWNFIRRYREMGAMTVQDHRNNISVQNRLCGTDKNYFDFMGQIFDKTVLPTISVKPEMWYDVPYTQSIKDMEAYLSGNGQRGGFLGIFRTGPRAVSPVEVVKSLGDFWNCCLEKYYIAPVMQWINSPQGKRELRDYMFSTMATVLTYNEMQTLLKGESEVVRSLCKEDNAKFPTMRMQGGSDIAAMLHDIALYETKRAIYKQVLSLLADTMKALSENAGGFDTLLGTVQNSLYADKMEHSVVVSYGNYVDQLINQNRDILLKSIRPCKTEHELLEQLEAVFGIFVEKDTKQIFRMSLQEDLKFRTDNSGAIHAVDAINNCFSFDMTNAGRLLTLTAPVGTLYCIMNGAMEDLGDSIPEGTVGNRFIVTRTDRIERLYLYPVDENNIMYSNQGS